MIARNIYLRWRTIRNWFPNLVAQPYYNLNIPLHRDGESQRLSRAPLGSSTDLSRVFKKLQHPDFVSYEMKDNGSAVYSRRIHANFDIGLA